MTHRETQRLNIILSVNAVRWKPQILSNTIRYSTGSKILIILIQSFTKYLCSSGAIYFYCLKIHFLVKLWRYFPIAVNSIETKQNLIKLDGLYFPSQVLCNYMIIKPSSEGKMYFHKGQLLSWTYFNLLEFWGWQTSQLKK